MRYSLPSSVLLLSGLLLITSCGNDDDTSIPTDSAISLIGSWKMVSAFTMNETTSDLFFDTTTTVRKSVSIDPSDYAITFRGNPKEISSTGSVTFENSITDIAGYTRTFTSKSAGNFTAGTWQYDPPQLFVTDPTGFVTPSTVRILTTTELIFDYELIDTVSADAPLIVERYTATYAFVRQ